VPREDVFKAMKAMQPECDAICEAGGIPISIDGISLGGSFTASESTITLALTGVEFFEEAADDISITVDLSALDVSKGLDGLFTSMFDKVCRQASASCDEY
jgi:hypothetical protein